jgi:hypothetical protein
VHAFTLLQFFVFHGKIWAVERKPQQQTLSIRVSDALREFLERAKHVMSNGRGESVSTSDVAKVLLESAKDDRLDFRLEVAELQQAPTESLANIRRKWEHHQALSRAEWIFLAQYVQIACEELSENPAVPTPDALAVVLEALRAVRTLRTDRGAGLDRYYLGNLGIPDAASFNERQFDPDFVPQIITAMVRDLRASSNQPKPVFAGRNFYVALRDESLNDVVSMSSALESFLPTLFRLAARGHWIRERRPVRIRRDGPIHHSTALTRSERGIRLTATMGTDGEVQLTLSLDDRGIIYPIGPYPEIQELTALFQYLEPGKDWDGIHFHATVEALSAPRFQFRRHADGVALTFTEDEWKTLKAVFATALAEAKVQNALSELAMVYGEL